MRTRYVDFDDRNEDLAERMRADPATAQEFLTRYELSWLYHENALEGVVYSGQELATALAGAPLADATFVSALQTIRNHKNALDLVRQEAASKKLRVNLTLVKKVHETLASGFEGRAAGDQREDMPLHRAYYHEIAQPGKIAKEMNAAAIPQRLDPAPRIGHRCGVHREAVADDGLGHRIPQA